MGGGARTGVRECWRGADTGERAGVLAGETETPREVKASVKHPGSRAGVALGNPRWPAGSRPLGENPGSRPRAGQARLGSGKKNGSECPAGDMRSLQAEQESRPRGSEPPRV